MSDVWVKLARCCTPVPGDEILGFVTRGSGVSVHRTDCINAADAAAPSPSGSSRSSGRRRRASVFLVAIQVEALDRHPAAVRRHPGAVRRARQHPVGVGQTTRDRVAVCRFTFEMGDPKHLGHVLQAVRSVEGVFDVYRVTA